MKAFLFISRICTEEMRVVEIKSCSRGRSSEPIAVC